MRPMLLVSQMRPPRPSSALSAKLMDMAVVVDIVTIVLAIDTIATIVPTAMERNERRMLKLKSDRPS
ncbi:hypothetical protein GPALN_003441 [Globodera pallida]|uniref:Neur_chan_memb domain-containing protein n=1 Tax=Globodera pallida TaxID=36090 RepID=A0A183BX43_GLOPA|nr:hypothetical protein GPALN_003441 [Globodera pallida]